MRKAVDDEHGHGGGNAGVAGLQPAAAGTLALVDVHVLDHIVVGHNRAASMAELGLV